MNATIVRADSRGQADHGWLQSQHTFSFANYHNPERMGFGALRVINEDRVQPGQGFGTHPHENMEIISYVLDGALEHKDNMGTTSVIRPGEVQRMSAGTGVLHSEFNHSDSELVHFLQIWILPERDGLEPGYEQTTFPDEEKRGRLCLIGSRDGRDGSVTIHQDVNLYLALLSDGDVISHALSASRKVWLQVTRGALQFEDQPLAAGDGVSIEGPATISLTGNSDAELLLFDMGE